MVELDDLRRAEVLHGLGGEADHQHRAEREVRREEDRDPAVPGQGVDARVIGLPAARADDARHTAADRALDVADHGIRRV